MHGESIETCPGSKVALPIIDGATHPYVGAVSACWPPFAEVNVSLPPAPMSRLVPDACLVQHPGAPEHRATQSLGLQLLGL